jgi:hypothetical protein
MDVLGFELLEEDPEHEGSFLCLPGSSQTIDIVPIDALSPKVAARYKLGPGPMHHIAFRVGSYAALREARDTLIEHDVAIQALMDHVNLDIRRNFHRRRG